MDISKNPAVNTSKINNLAVGMLVIGLIVGFIVGWIWHKNVSGKVTKDTSSEIDENATTTTDSVTGLPLKDQTASISSSGVANFMKKGGYYGQPDLVKEGIGLVKVSAQSAGSAVMVSEITLPATGWVAIREVAPDGSGYMANIIGARRMPAGTSNNVNVPLQRGTVVGKTYFVTLYQDDGNQAVFKKGSDFLLTQNGTPIASQFVAQ